MVDANMTGQINTRNVALMMVLTMMLSLVPAGLVPAQGQNADLSLTSADITFSKDNPTGGEVITITAKVHNEGPGVATNVVVSFAVGNVPIPPTKTIATIGAMNAQDAAHQWVTPVPGTYTIKVSVQGDQPDPNTGNNQAERSITVGTVVPTINVTATIDPETIESKGTFTVNGTAQIGTEPVNGGDVKVEVVQNGYADSTKTNTDGSFEVVMEEGPTSQGLYNVKVTVTQGAVSGSTQLNLTVLQPDMNITTFRYIPKDPTEGDTVKFTIGVQNLGNGTAKGVKFELKVDNVVALDKDLGDFTNGQTKNVEYNWKAKKGSHTFQATVDVNNTIEEINENNNAWPTQTVTVKAKSGGRPVPAFEAPVFIIAVLVIFFFMSNGRLKGRKQER